MHQKPLQPSLDRASDRRNPRADLVDGILDLIESDHIIVEFKATAKTMDDQSVEDLVQLTCCELPLSHALSKRSKNSEAGQFRQNQDPKIVPLETIRNAHDSQRLFYLAQEVLRGIRSGAFLPVYSFMCKDCEYREPCESWEGNPRE